MSSLLQVNHETNESSHANFNSYTIVTVKHILIKLKYTSIRHATFNVCHALRNSSTQNVRQGMTLKRQVNIENPHGL